LEYASSATYNPQSAITTKGQPVMARDLNGLIETMLQASQPEQIFGKLGNPPEEGLRRQYRELAMTAHPDHNPGAWAAANEAFRQLQGWHAAAQRKLAAGTYGKHERIRATIAGRTYVGYTAPIAGDLCEIFPVDDGHTSALLKVARNPRSSDLLQAEAQALHRIERQLDGEKIRAHFPHYVESFTLGDSAGQRRHVNVLRPEQGTYSLAEVLRAYPNGLHLADAAWMFNRLLAALATTHSLGLIHGAVLPEHLLIRPSDHNGILIDWCYSVAIGEPIKAISQPHADAYPPEVPEKQPATPASDLYMAAGLLARMLGGEQGEPPAHTAKPIAALLRACRIPTPARRHNDAWQVLDDFRAILADIYGPPAFRPFQMP
jgi:serine/threonine protein kinase